MRVRDRVDGFFVLCARMKFGGTGWETGFLGQTQKLRSFSGCACTTDGGSELLEGGVSVWIELKFRRLESQLT